MIVAKVIPFKACSMPLPDPQPYVVEAVTHYMIEHGELAGCGTGCSAATLLDAVRQGIRQLEYVPEWDGRGPKLLLVFDGAGRVVFKAKRSGEWTAATSRRALTRAERLVGRPDSTSSSTPTSN